MNRIKWTLLAACAASFAVTVARADFLASEKEVRRQARTLWLQTKRHVPLDPDERVQRYAKCITSRIIAQLPPDQREAYEWEVLVFEDDEAQATADPNGKIAVANGLLKIADTQDALAAAIGHEVSHATLGHVLDNARRAARQDNLSTIGAAVTGVQMREFLHYAVALPFRREQEIEADVTGLARMAKAGFDPRASINLWKGMLAHRESLGREQPPEFYSSHPPEKVRLDRLIQVLGPALVEYNAALEAGRHPNCQAQLTAPLPDAKGPP